MEGNKTFRAYHGSRQKFNNFNYSYIGSHALENGFGIYFTTDPNIAQTYGDYVLEADITMHDLFSIDSITITKEQVKEYIRKYVDPTGEDYLSNYGWYADEGYDNVLNKCVDMIFSYNQSDNDILSEIFLEIQNKYTDEAFDAIYKIFKKDGIVYTGYSDFDGEEITNYIVYSNKQVTNKNWIPIKEEL